MTYYDRLKSIWVPETKEVSSHLVDFSLGPLQVCVGKSGGKKQYLKKPSLVMKAWWLWSVNDGCCATDINPTGNWDSSLTKSKTCLPPGRGQETCLPSDPQNRWAVPEENIKQKLSLREEQCNLLLFLPQAKVSCYWWK